MEIEILSVSFAGQHCRTRLPFRFGVVTLTQAPVLAARVKVRVAGDVCEGHSVSDPDGDGAARSMEMALEDAGVAIDEVDYINAHGTSTPLNDRLETMAIKRTFGEQAYKMAVSSTKSMTGHLLGGAGGIESVYTVLSIDKEVIPPTINYETPDPECDLDYVPNTPRKLKVRSAITNSFGFGGTNATILFRQPEASVA